MANFQQIEVTMLGDSHAKKTFRHMETFEYMNYRFVFRDATQGGATCATYSPEAIEGIVSRTTPDLVFLFLGSNDLDSEDGPKNSQHGRFAEPILDVWWEFQIRHKVETYVLALPNRFTYRSSVGRHRYQLRSSTSNEILQEQIGSKFLELPADCYHCSGYCKDKVHLTNELYMKIASNVCEVLMCLGE